MRLYLSSFRLGDHSERLQAMLRPNARVAVIANAIDSSDQARRTAGVEYEVGELRKLALGATELDLRHYFGRYDELAKQLTRYELLWVCGGNVFMLRHALAESRADGLIKELLARDAIAYGGYSAGVCVLGPSLRGIELVNDPTAVTRIHDAAPRWDGLGLIPYAVVPHYRSPGHPQTELCERLAEYYATNGVEHRLLRDGQAIVIEGEETEVV